MRKPRKTPAAKPSSGAIAEYEPTEKELALAGKFFAALRPSPRVKLTKGGDGSKWELEHPHPTIAKVLFAAALGTADMDFARGLLQQLATATASGREIDEEGLNFMLSIVKGIEPKDQVEAMLAAQMAAVHTETMTATRRLSQADTLQQYDSAERALNKLARTFVAQVEALKRYRTGGEQKVTVQHVSVSDGGQAIVGNVTQSSQEDASEKAPIAITDARVAPMPILGKRRVRAPVRPLRRKK